MRELLEAVGGARAVLFDVDGTLYEQRPVRRAMAMRLLRAHVAAPHRGLRTVRTLGAYRKAQEALREAAFEGDVAAEQTRRAAAAVRSDDAAVAALVARWMEQEPLGVVAASARTGLADLLDELATRGTRLGVVSDYPATAKLAALGIADRFEVVVTAQDPRVRAFKPSPNGILVALDDLGIAPADAVYVGDRPDVDGAAAAAAGTRFVLVGAPAPMTDPRNDQLRELL